MDKYILSFFLIAVASSNELDSSQDARILNYEFQNDGSGPYYFQYQQSDGQSREEQAELESNNLVVRGSFSFTAQDGKTYTVQYTADKDGFHPEGDHINVPPYTPWPTNVHLPDDYPEHSHEDPSKVYLPSSERPPISNLKPLLFNEEFTQGSLNIPMNLGESIPSNIYLPSTPGPQVSSVTVSGLNHIGAGSSPVPAREKADGAGKGFEVIQNNHSNSGVFVKEK